MRLASQKYLLIFLAITKSFSSCKYCSQSFTNLDVFFVFCSVFLLIYLFVLTIPLFFLVDFVAAFSDLVSMCLSFLGYRADFLIKIDPDLDSSVSYLSQFSK